MSLEFIVLFERQRRFSETSDEPAFADFKKIKFELNFIMTRSGSVWRVEKLFALGNAFFS
jgi:hypothetical protein